MGVTERGPAAGFSWGASAKIATLDGSRTGALQICRGEHPNYKRPISEITAAQNACEIVGTFKDQCAGLALNGDQYTATTAYGWAIAADSKTVTSEALARCEAMRQDHDPACRFFQAACDGDAK
jgi:hypothetical protein